MKNRPKKKLQNQKYQTNEWMNECNSEKKEAWTFTTMNNDDDVLLLILDDDNEKISKQQQQNWIISSVDIYSYRKSA